MPRRRVVPGEGAWQADLRPGDEILEVNGRRVVVFGDLLQAVIGDVQNGMTLVVRRPGEEKLLDFKVQADPSGGRPHIGVLSASMTTLGRERIAALPASPAAEAKPPFQPGDTIVQLDDQPIHSYAELRAYLGNHADKPLRVVVERKAKREEGAAKTGGKSEALTIEVAPNPMKWFGLVMEMGPISAIQANSPAAAAGVAPGGTIRTLDGKPAADPLTLPQAFRALRGRDVVLGIEYPRKGIKEFRLKVGGDGGFTQPLFETNPMTIPALGIAYRALNRVREAVPGSPAAKAGLQGGDELVSATILPPDDAAIKRLAKAFHEPDLYQLKYPISFDKKDANDRNWPHLMWFVQCALPETTLELEWLRGKETMKATLAPTLAPGCFDPERGFVLKPDDFLQTAASLDEAVRLGAAKTLDSTLAVFKIIRAMSSGRVSMRNVGGPGTIFSAGYQSAKEGPGNLLMFLTLLSANLAVLNFLPIPILDGGHFVFLTWEAVRGKPADERVQVVLTLIGLALILTLMVWAIGLDLGWISRFVR